MSYVQPYPLQKALPKIQRHDQLPFGTKEVARCLDPTDGPRFENLYVFVKRDYYLSLLVAYDRTNPKTNVTEYNCKQFDFPLRVLSWFPKALEEFRAPPIAGGLPAGKIISTDQNVDGEMLAVGSTTDGYDLTNRSRQSPFGSGESYEPTRLSFKWEFLYKLGFLDLWKKLGEQYERGQL